MATDKTDTKSYPLVVTDEMLDAAMRVARSRISTTAALWSDVHAIVTAALLSSPKSVVDEDLDSPAEFWKMKYFEEHSFAQKLEQERDSWRSQVPLADWEKDLLQHYRLDSQEDNNE